MPKSTRWALKEKVDQVILKTSKSKNEMCEIAAVFESTHPDYFNTAMLIASQYEPIEKFLEQFRDAI